MTCDMTRSAMEAGPEGAWPSDVVAHVTGCDDCAAAAVEWSLRHRPAIGVPPTFAIDVARRARLDAPPERQRIGALVGAGTAAVLTAIALASFGTTGGTPAAVPVAVLLLAAGEAIVLAAWTLHGDVVRAHVRR